MFVIQVRYPEQAQEVRTPGGKPKIVHVWRDVPDEVLKAAVSRTNGWNCASNAAFYMRALVHCMPFDFPLRVIRRSPVEGKRAVHLLSRQDVIAMKQRKLNGGP